MDKHLSRAVCRVVSGHLNSSQYRPLAAGGTDLRRMPQWSHAIANGYREASHSQLRREKKFLATLGEKDRARDASMNCGFNRRAGP
jgi:hypothetical protein